MHTYLLLSAFAALTQARILQLPSIQKDVAADVKKLDSALLVDAPALSFSAETNLTNARFKAGDSLHFFCEAVGTPLVNVYWTLNGRVIQGSRRRSNLERMRNAQRVMIGQNVVASRLQLACVDERMSGTLSCVADNGFEAKKTSVQISTAAGAQKCARLRPTVPQIGSWTASRIEEVGNAVVFQCRKTAPATRIRWETEAGEDVRDREGFMVLPTGDLLIGNVQWHHMGSYFCVASDDKGNESRTETFVYPTDKDAMAEEAEIEEAEAEEAEEDEEFEE